MGFTKQSGVCAAPEKVQQQTPAARQPKVKKIMPVPRPPVPPLSPECRPRATCARKQLRKTKVCFYHLKGACQYGEACSFAHSRSELQGVPDLRKTQLCKAFLQGQCKDTDCNFAHGNSELRRTNLNFKTTLCIWNEHGKCRNGALCRFAHGLEELRNNKVNEDQTSSTTTTPRSTEASLGHTAQSVSGSSTVSEKCDESSIRIAASMEPMKVHPSGMISYAELNASLASPVGSPSLLSLSDPMTVPMLSDIPVSLFGMQNTPSALRRAPGLFSATEPLAIGASLVHQTVGSKNVSLGCGAVSDAYPPQESCHTDLFSLLDTSSDSWFAGCKAAPGLDAIAVHSGWEQGNCLTGLPPLTTAVGACRLSAKGG